MGNLDGWVEEKYVDEFASKVDEIPCQMREHLDRNFKRNYDISFYYGMLRNALNDFELVNKVIKSNYSEELRTVGKHLLWNVSYIAYSIKKIQEKKETVH